MRSSDDGRPPGGAAGARRRGVIDDLTPCITPRTRSPHAPVRRAGRAARPRRAARARPGRPARPGGGRGRDPGGARPDGARRRPDDRRARAVAPARRDLGDCRARRVRQRARRRPRRDRRRLARRPGTDVRRVEPRRPARPPPRRPGRRDRERGRVDRHLAHRQLLLLHPRQHGRRQPAVGQRLPLLDGQRELPRDRLRPRVGPRAEHREDAGGGARARRLEDRHLHARRRHGPPLRGRCAGRPEHGRDHHAGRDRRRQHDRQRAREVRVRRGQPLQGPHEGLPPVRPGAHRGRGRGDRRRVRGRRGRGGRRRARPRRHERRRHRPRAAGQGRRRRRGDVGDLGRGRRRGERRGDPPRGGRGPRDRDPHRDRRAARRERDPHVRRHGAAGRPRPGEGRRRGRRARGDEPRRRAWQPHAAHDRRARRRGVVGVVVGPAHGEDDETVTLTATVRVGAATATRELVAHVPALPEQEDLEGYLFSYFIGEGYADGEQVYFGLSRGNDALRYQNLNDNEPVLTSELGEEGLRDPFIIRSPEGDKFYQIATDLKIYGNGNWDASQRTGSKSIMVWESTDLVNWTDQRLVKVSPETAGNTWAPEAYYDESIGAYVVFWASKLYAEDDPGHTGSSYNRMMYATTRDFVTFSEAKVWVDPGYSVIDSTVTEHDGAFYRFTKDERNNTSSTPCSKFILAEKATELRSTDYEFITDCIGKANSLGGGINQGEGPTIFKSNTEEKWYLFIDEFGGRGYVPFESTSLDAAEWTMSSGYEMPSRPRHGTVLPVTQAEYDRLLQAYQPDAFVESVEDVEVTVQTGTAPVLPATVTARYADGSSGAADVAWDEVDLASYAQEGTFEVAGSFGGGVSVQVRAVVTVTDDVVPGEGHALVTATTADGSRTAYVAVEVTADVPGLVVRYALDETSKTSAANSAPGSSFGAATLTNGARFAGSGEGVVLDGTDDYVDLPDHLLAGLTDVTVGLDVKVATDQSTPYFIYGLGNSSGSNGNGYLFTTGNAYRTSIATGNWTTEQTVTKNANLQRGVWKHLTYTLSGTTAVLYEDGVEVGRQTGVTIDPKDIGNGSTLANYIGRSLYSGDRYLKGSVRDFRVYDRALTADEVYQVGADHTAVTGAELDALKVPAIVDGASSTVTLAVVPGTDVTALAPELTVSSRATVSPANGSVQDFTQPVEYTVTGPDGSSRTWTVQAKQMGSPVLAGKYADPNIAQFGDTFYLYATTDGTAGWGGKEFYVWKSTDLVTWERSEQPFLTLDGANGNVPWATGNAWAPTIIERDGKYFFYFSGHNPTYNRKTIGVAVASSPEGPFFAQPTAMILNNEAVTSGQAIDPAVFQDPVTR